MTRTTTREAGFAECAQVDIDDLLRSHGLRPTKARRLLLAHLKSTTRHPSAEEITDQLRRDGVGIGVATVYQNLSRLVDAGLLIRLSGSNGCSRYDADVSSHDHAVCERCGRVADFDPGPRVRNALEEVSPCETGLGEWSLTRTSVEMLGICPECRAS